MILLAPIVWPLAILSIAVIFRRDVGHALGRIGRVKYRDLELTFREDLHQAEQLARTIPAADRAPLMFEAAKDEPAPLVGRLIVAPSSPNPSIERPDSREAPAARSPRESIEAGWGVLAKALERASSGKRTRVLLDTELAKLVGLLRTLGHRASRFDQPPPSPEDARRYVDLAMGAAMRIEALD